MRPCNQGCDSNPKPNRSGGEEQLEHGGTSVLVMPSSLAVNVSGICRHLTKTMSCGFLVFRGSKVMLRHQLEATITQCQQTVGFGPKGAKVTD
jgi:hypothetical protein